MLSITDRKVDSKSGGIVDYSCPAGPHGIPCRDGSRRGRHPKSMPFVCSAQGFLHGLLDAICRQSVTDLLDLRKPKTTKASRPLTWKSSTLNPQALTQTSAIKDLEKALIVAVELTSDPSPRCRAAYRLSFRSCAWLSDPKVTQP